MKSPLALDKETVKKYGITEDLDVPPVVKMTFLQEQLGQLQHMQWRSRVDIMHATRLTESENEVLKNKGLQNLGQHVNEVQQSVGAIKMIKTLIDELRTEYPELKLED
jgi:hypothetical protein